MYHSGTVRNETGHPDESNHKKKHKTHPSSIKYLRDSLKGEGNGKFRKDEGIKRNRFLLPSLGEKCPDLLVQGEKGPVIVSVNNKRER